MKQKILAGLLVIMIVLSFLPSFVGPQDVYGSSTTLTPSKDTFIQSVLPNENFGTLTMLEVGGATNPRFRVLVEFEEPWGSTVPAGAQITSAYLQVYYYGYVGSNPVGTTARAQRLLRVGLDPWLETHANWNRYISGSNWAVAGAASSGTDYTTDGQASTTVPASDGWISWDVTVQAQWAQSNSEDVAFRVVLDDETSSKLAYFYSREYATSAYRPRLIINYTYTPLTVTTGTADEITQTTARCFGDVTSTGGLTVTRRGIQYGLTQNATWDNYETGSFGAGEYSRTLSSLTTNTTYYYRAYAVNGAGYAYGSWLSFTTATGLPIVVTVSADPYGNGCWYADLYGNITSIGDSAVNRRGFQYGLNQSSPSSVYEDGSFGTGTYNLTTSALVADECYYYRAYARNTQGTAYGEWMMFCTTVGGCIPIHDVNELQAMSNNLTACYFLANDIDASGFGFVPLGTFTGTLDGENYVVNNLTITVSGAGVRQGALFVLINGGTVENLGLVDCVISITSTDSHAYAAGLAIDNSGTIENCHVTGTITATSPTAARYVTAAALANWNYGSISDSYASATVKADGYYAQAGGLVLSNAFGGDIDESHASGDVEADGDYRATAGGFVTFNSFGSINNCYARGDSLAHNGTDYNRAGGFVAVNENATGNITNAYSSGVPTGGTIGGFCAVKTAGSILDCFWDTETSGTVVSDGGTGKNTTEMKTLTTFSAWDIEGYSELLNGGYPFLGWEVEDASTWYIAVEGMNQLVVSTASGGTVTEPGIGTFSYDPSTVVDLLAVADEGYEFFAWTGDTGTVDDAVNANTTITMNGDYVIVANFAPTETCNLLLGLAATEGGNITAPGEGVFTFPCGSLVTITAEPYSGWWFQEWTGDVETVSNPLSFNTTVQMLDDYSITANFVEEESPPVGAPNVTTLAATDIMSSSAWLNGELVSLGNYTQGYVFLQYGTTTSYGTNTREQLRTATGNFSAWVGNLATNTTYHFRAACRYGSYVYGADGNFTTLEGETCADCLWAGIQPYESLLTGDDDMAMVYGANWYGQTFTVETESHSAVDVRFLVYRVGEPSTITVSIRECGDDGMPTGDDLTSGTFDGDSVTNSTGGSWYGTTLTETGLAYGETYALLVRAEAGDDANYLAMRIDTGNGYSGGQAITSGSSGIIWTADTGNDALFQIYGKALIRVYEAKVFTSYLETGDALIVLSYLNTYVPYYPDEIASLHFLLQLRSSNGDTILSQTVCQQWGYMPGSIYLNANQSASLTNGWPYRIYLAGTSAEKPVACYILQPDDWLGDAIHLLCPWAIATANSMATYYSTPMTTQIQNKEVLNSEGGTLFATGIPSMIITDPECFQDISYIPGSGTITPGPTEFDTSTTWEAQVGPIVARLANGIGGVFGDISGKYIIGIIFFVMYLLMCYFVVRQKADPIIGTFLFVPIFLGVAELRVLDFQLVAALGAVAVIMTVYRYFWSRT